MSLKKILEPVTLNKTVVKNRIARTAHGEHLDFMQYGGDNMIAYHLARAKGGVGMTILGIADVDPSTMGVANVYDDAVVPRFQKLMRTLEPYDMKVIQQLWHGGHHYPTAFGGPPPAPSTVPSPFPRALIPGVGVPMDKAEIRRLVGAYAAAAHRVKEGGLHGVEIHAAHSYLVSQFLSPVTNTRTDEYGGSVVNRMRFLREIYEEIRTAVGDDYVVGCRLSVTWQSAGLHEEDVNVIAHGMEELGINYISAGIGDYWRIESTIGGMVHPTGYNLPYAREFLKDIKVPKIVSGRFRTLEEGEQVLRAGTADLIGYVRALIADPDLVKKTLAGEAERVRPCIACNQGCIGGIMRFGGLGCTVNPATGFESTLAEDLIVKSAAPKKVVVVGGGPAGMEAARIAALEGHRVVLMEASARLGGAALAASKASRPNAIGDIVVWHDAELYRLGVDVRLNCYADADDIAAEKPDQVIVATGSRPRMDGYNLMAPGDPIRGVDQPHVMSSNDLLMAPPANLGKSALVLDNVGHFEGILTAIHLVQQGLAVTYVTHHRAFAPFVQTTLRDDSLLELAEKGEFELIINHLLLDIGKGECVIRSRSGTRRKTVAADTVVLVTSNEPNRELFNELKAKGISAVLVGDALSPRGMQEAIAEGHRAARAVN